MKLDLQKIATLVFSIMGLYLLGMGVIEFGSSFGAFLMRFGQRLNTMNDLAVALRPLLPPLAINVLPGILIFCFREKLSFIILSGVSSEGESTGQYLAYRTNPIMWLRLILCAIGVLYVTRGISLLLHGILNFPDWGWWRPSASSMDYMRWILRQILSTGITLGIGCLLIFKNPGISAWLAKKAHIGMEEDERSQMGEA